MSTIMLAAALALAVAAPAAEDEPPLRPPPPSSPTPGGASWERAAPPAVSGAGTRRPVVAAVSPAPETRSAAEAGGLQGVRAIALKEGEARLLVGGSAVCLRPGSVLGSDVVKSVGSDRVIFVRGATPTHPAGAATVVVSFDAQGRSRVRVYWLGDPAAIAPREVR